MKFTLTIDMDNDAFGIDPEGELTDILGKVSDKIATGVEEGSVRDSNGNTVGSWEIMS